MNAGVRQGFGSKYLRLLFGTVSCIEDGITLEEECSCIRQLLRSLQRVQNVSNSLNLAQQLLW